MGVNKVVYGQEVIIDTSKTTVTPETLFKGVTAIDAAGNLITGMMDIKQLKQIIIPSNIITAATIDLTGYSATSGIIDVYNNGFKLDKTEYTVTGTNIAFTTAIEAGSVIEIIYTFLGV